MSVAWLGFAVYAIGGVALAVVVVILLTPWVLRPWLDDTDPAERPAAEPRT